MSEIRLNWCYEIASDADYQVVSRGIGSSGWPSFA